MSAILSQKEIQEVSWGDKDNIAITAENLLAGLEALARAQAQHLMKLLDSTATHYPKLLKYRIIYDKDWQALWDEVFCEMKK